VRPLLGTTPRALARRGLELARRAILRLTRDAFADAPGSGLDLFLAERTQYVAACIVLDEFLRADGDLGVGYLAVVGFDALALVDQAATAAAVGEAGLMAYDSLHARDQWAEGTLVDLAGAADRAQLGVAVRLTLGGSGYVATAEITPSSSVTRLIRYTIGTPTVLDEVDTPWVPGDVLRLEAEWDQLRVYRRGVLIVSVTDSSPQLGTGRPGIQAVTADSGDVARLTAFAAGPLRQEYPGLLADVGDVTASLGLVEPTASPQSWAMTVVNCAPVGGASRFAALLRHGLNAGAGTYDLHRARVRVVHAVRGGSIPLAIADGRVSHPEAMTETTVRLVCLGRDAFLTPRVRPVTVTYLPGPDPVLTPAPVPDDPCGADEPPTVVPGGPAEEPTTPPSPTPAEDAKVAEGPDAPPGGGGDGVAPPLLGTYTVLLGGENGAWYTLTKIGGQDVYVGSTLVYGPHDGETEVGDGGLGAPGPLTPERDEMFRLEVNKVKGAESEAFPFLVREIWMYRGPNVPGTDLVKECFLANCAPAYSLYAFGNFVYGPGGTTAAGITLKLARYDASGIHTVADLEALRPRNPGETDDPLPTRIETVEEWAVTLLTVNSSIIRGRTLVPTAATNQFSGPQLLRLELVDGWSTGQPANTNAFAALQSQLDSSAFPVGMAHLE
jgi:hypothetical protein